VAKFRRLIKAGTGRSSTIQWLEDVGIPVHGPHAQLVLGSCGCHPYGSEFLLETHFVLWYAVSYLFHTPVLRPLFQVFVSVTHRYPWVSVGTMGSYWRPWVPMGSPLVVVVTHGFPRVLTGTHGYTRVHGYMGAPGCPQPEPKTEI
jgi:hypothetical protein